ncbi:hypothetical protein [Herbaspirillum sp. B65]|uniref:hypothetical protein n=1 Tax=Herbaspirillum sp. B65 TaxID=137708 RepID=UPI0003481BCE
MQSVSQALDILLAAAVPVEQSETIDTLDACGRVLAAPVTATINVPGMDNSQMDGYAVRAGDCVSGDTRLRVSQRISGGTSAKR